MIKTGIILFKQIFIPTSFCTTSLVFGNTQNMFLVPNNEPNFSCLPITLLYQEFTQLFFKKIRYFLWHVEELITWNWPLSEQKKRNLNKRYYTGCLLTLHLSLNFKITLFQTEQNDLHLATFEWILISVSVSMQIERSALIN